MLLITMEEIVVQRNKKACVYLTVYVLGWGSKNESKMVAV